MTYEVDDYTVYDHDITVYGYCDEGKFKTELSAKQFLQHIAEGRGLFYDPQSALICLNTSEKDRTATICNMRDLIKHGTVFRTIINFTMDEEVQNAINMFSDELDIYVVEEHPPLSLEQEARRDYLDSVL